MKRWKCQDKGCDMAFNSFEELEAHHKQVDLFESLAKILKKKKNGGLKVDASWEGKMTAKAAWKLGYITREEFLKMRAEYKQAKQSE